MQNASVSDDTQNLVRKPEDESLVNLVADGEVTG
jgi:hypothetical protein